MKLKIRKGYLITIILLLILIVIGYKIRYRPMNNLNSYLKSNYPKVETKEANYVCDEFRNEAKKMFKYIIYTNPYKDSSDFSIFMKSKDLAVLNTNPVDISKKYNIKNSNDSIKVMGYITNSMYYIIDLKMKYLMPDGPDGVWKKRNFIERFFFFDFERSLLKKILTFNF
jgi:hypothetical protein